MAKEKEARRPFNLKKEVKLLPGYIILITYAFFAAHTTGKIYGQRHSRVDMTA